MKDDKERKVEYESYAQRINCSFFNQRSKKLAVLGKWEERNMRSQTSRQVAESESHSGCREKQRLHRMTTGQLEKKKNHRKTDLQKPELFRTSVSCIILPSYSCPGEEACNICQSFDESFSGTDFRSEGKVHMHASKLKVI